MAKSRVNAKHITLPEERKFINYKALVERRYSCYETIAKELFPNLSPKDALDALDAETDFYAFIKAAWVHIEPSEFVDGQHIREIAKHLQAFSDGRIKNLLANIPPRHTKSLLFSVFFPAWEWARRSPRPGCRGSQETYLTFSYSKEFALRDNWRARRLMASEWYQARWGRHWQFTSDQNVKGRYVNTHGGQRIAMAMATAVGEGGTRIGVDDPQSYAQATNPKAVAKVIEFWDGALGMRGFGDRTRKYLIMQRLGFTDLTAHIMAQIREGVEDWVVLILPIVYLVDTPPCITYTTPDPKDPTRPSRDGPVTNTYQDGLVVFGGDWRTKDYQPLWPELYGGTLEDDSKAREALKRIEAKTPEAIWASQGLQRPIPPGGLVFKRASWFPTYTQLPTVAEAGEYYLFSTWDCAIKEKDTADYTCGWLVAYYPSRGEYYVLHRWYGRWDFPDQQDSMRECVRITARERVLHVVEGGGNGSALVSSNRLWVAKEVVDGGGSYSESKPWHKWQEWWPRGMSKTVRATIVSPLFRAGKVFFPAWTIPQSAWDKEHHDKSGRWYQHMLDEFMQFPSGEHDDQVDALSQGILYMNQLGMDVFAAHTGSYHIGRPSANDLRTPNPRGLVQDFSEIWSPVNIHMVV